MEIVLDKEANEYGVFKKENAAEHFVKTNNRFVEAQSEMTPDHIFYSPDAKKMKLEDAPEEMKEMTLPVINFFDKNKKEYDTVIYSEINEERFEFIKPIKNLNEFFCFKRKKDKENN